MAIYAIADLHLSFQVKKPMDVFGKDWIDYETKLKENWNNTVNNDDTVIIAGDISWATYLDQGLEDFKFIDSLNGHKIIVKGNHDYWWETITKMNNFLIKHDIKNIRFLHNNSFEVGDYIICGTKGYEMDEKDEKIKNRETERLKNSLRSMKDKTKKLITVFHYPPFCNEVFMEILSEFNQERIIYGHIHGKNQNDYINKGIFSLVAVDYLNFMPLLIAD